MKIAATIILFIWFDLLFLNLVVEDPLLAIGCALICLLLLLDF